MYCKSAFRHWLGVTNHGLGLARHRLARVREREFQRGRCCRRSFVRVAVVAVWITCCGRMGVFPLTRARIIIVSSLGIGILLFHQAVRLQARRRISLGKGSTGSEVVPQFRGRRMQAKQAAVGRLAHV